MAINGMTKGPRTPLLRWVCVQLLYGSVSAWQSWWCSQNLCRPFPQAVRFLYITLDYVEQFSPTSSVIMCRKISSTEPKLWSEAMWPYSNPLSTCNINAVVTTCMLTHIHTPPFLIYTGGDLGNEAGPHSFSS